MKTGTALVGEIPSAYEIAVLDLEAPSTVAFTLNMVAPGDVTISTFS
jgi:hypothetical protein